MRGADITQEPLFTTIRLDERVPDDHPLRSIKTLFDQALTHIDWKLSLIYSERGRESIPPERLLRALLLQILFSIRSERQLVEQIQYTCSIAGLSAGALMKPHLFGMSPLLLTNKEPNPANTGFLGSQAVAAGAHKVANAIEKGAGSH
ncbi:transposase [Oceanobacter sp. 5_MG-2023]|uniref:transposase n=1 Tax=Oceanobacter sp. 5_MG-2023 TaxID=3062645 RepID=UPI0026E13FE7|nr:transposase [Oceanobacter sp. 5_MG-2023]MDO6681199.1 transposase [Oceanobacter sp. 5_MG-2023]